MPFIFWRCKDQLSDVFRTLSIHVLLFCAIFHPQVFGKYYFLLLSNWWILKSLLRLASCDSVFSYCCLFLTLLLMHIACLTLIFLTVPSVFILFCKKDISSLTPFCITPTTIRNVLSFLQMQNGAYQPLCFLFEHFALTFSFFFFLYFLCIYSLQHSTHGVLLNSQTPGSLSDTRCRQFHSLASQWIKIKDRKIMQWALHSKM